MTNTEIIAYNYGRRLAEGAVETVKGGRDDIMVTISQLTAEEQAAMEKLGRDAWWKFVLQGGQEVLGDSRVVRTV
jgi:hypothetical protein